MKFRTWASLLGLVVLLVVAVSVKASPAPDGAESDCGWAENGVVITIGGVEYRCLCAMLTGPAGKRVLCRWYRVDTLPQPKKPKPKPAPPKKPKPKNPSVRVYPKPSVVA